MFQGLGSSGLGFSGLLFEGPAKGITTIGFRY